MTTNETQRLRALYEYKILDSEAEGAYDDLTRLASLICGTPIAAVSLIDEHRQWFKSAVGLSVRQTEREVAFCHHAIQGPGILVVEDATLDPRFVNNRLVTGEPNIRFYAGAPLIDVQGCALGTLCVIDTHPRQLTPSQLEGLDALGRQATALLAGRRVNSELQALGKLSVSRLNKTRALQAISSALISQGNVGDVQQKAVDLIAAALPADRVAMFTVDVANRSVLAFRKGGPGASQAMPVSFEELWGGLTGWVLRKGTPALSPRGLPDDRESVDVQARRSRTRCGDIIVVPINCDGNTLGTITAINDPAGVEFDSDHIDLMMAMANQIATAMRSHRLYCDLIERTNDLKAVTERMSLAIAAAEMGVWEWDIATNRLRWDEQMYQVYGRERTADTEALSFWSQAVHPEDLPRIEASVQVALSTGKTLDEDFRIRLPDASVRHLKVTARGQKGPNGEITRMVGVNFDITERKLAEIRMQKDARRDKLTDLANRAAFLERLSSAVLRVQEGRQRRYAVLFLDFDGFKQVNDTLGHKAGDELLRGIASRLRNALRASDIVGYVDTANVVSRFGGDEFLVLINDLDSAIAVDALAKRLLAVLEATYEIDGNSVRSTASIGIVTSDSFLGNAEEIVHKADLAMYAAKRAGRARAVTYTASMAEEAKRRA